MATMKVKSTLDPRHYKHGVKEMRRENKKFGGGLGKIKKLLAGAFVATAVVGFARAVIGAGASIVQFASKLSDMAAQTGVNIMTLQKFNAAALNAGSSADKMTKALVSLKDAQGEVLDGDMLMTRAFGNLGISIDDVASMDTEELFLAVSRALTDSGNSAKNLSAVFDILGKRNAMELTEAMNELAEGINGVDQAMIKMTFSTAQRLDIAADWWERYKVNWKTGWAIALASLFGGGDKVEAEIEKRRRAEEKRNKREKESRAFDLEQLKAKKEEERLRTVEKIAKAEEKIAKDKQKIREDVTRDATRGKKADRLRRIGGFAGQTARDQLTQSRKQVEILERIADYERSLPAIEQNTNNMGLV
jgi:hypothetical protein